MSKVRIDTVLLNKKIEQLIKENEKINGVLENFKTDSLEIPDYWKGNTGDKVSNNLKNYSDKFSDISYKLQNYIDFLKAVSQAYEDEEQLITNEIEKNVYFSV